MLGATYIVMQNHDTLTSIMEYNPIEIMGMLSAFGLLAIIIVVIMKKVLDKYVDL